MAYRSGWEPVHVAMEGVLPLALECQRTVVYLVVFPQCFRLARCPVNVRPTAFVPTRRP